MGPVNLRVIGLGAVVTAAVLLPLVAMAGPTGEPVRPVDAAHGGDAAGEDAKAGGGAADLLEGLGLGSSTPVSPDPSTPAAAPAAPGLPERVTNCGPELASPDGVEAQTCVLAEGRDTWARTYYRNASGQGLDAFLTLMAPGGRTVQVRCVVTAQDEPGTCETPRERARGAATAYTAVAEFAGAGEGDSTPLLLRAGSNTADSEGS
ncbi:MULTISPECIES: hypothetical protein [unclassified Streptomyces]|uniref:hypothetical protein n=1 Tax=unclassified Streptomyces TaxID=2593676 RepID=UPI0006F2E4FD|nr:MULTISPECIES: hypothetical protein [unclassified Streptomyces]KQX49396.1 hypothetical protein ASD33_16725 [Streptomyces sp. Root1304]KRA79014.1 hypothetical protein ASE09_21245 [Streptomyces sp. Root66D1]